MFNISFASIRLIGTKSEIFAYILYDLQRTELIQPVPQNGESQLRLGDVALGGENN